MPINEIPSDFDRPSNVQQGWAAQALQNILSGGRDPMDYQMVGSISGIPTLLSAIQSWNDYVSRQNQMTNQRNMQTQQLASRTSNEQANRGLDWHKMLQGQQFEQQYKQPFELEKQRITSEAAGKQYTGFANAQAKVAAAKAEAEGRVQAAREKAARMNVDPQKMGNYLMMIKQMYPKLPDAEAARRAQSMYQSYSQGKPVDESIFGPPPPASPGILDKYIYPAAQANGFSPDLTGVLKNIGYNTSPMLLLRLLKSLRGGSDPSATESMPNAYDANWMAGS